ncbi:hypothetical protein ACVR0O_06110 [Streptococcus caviae]|uniref:hypothetical protein n=1 Tax=Streptococcus sp. 'caviae' TaxID=1915004 RepID=UPI00094B8462|nr:hypothetical protein [Streptococcus sp. 'caviae']OLN83588.1 hypothetical protein BMI76_05460 [Streptococcus sp. 'caviae']
MKLNLKLTEHTTMSKNTFVFIVIYVLSLVILSRLRKYEVIDGNLFLIFGIMEILATIYAWIVFIKIVIGLLSHKDFV